MSRELKIHQRVRTSLRRHAHQLLAAGYALLTPPAYATWKEPDITGELCQAMDEFRESDSAPSWCSRYEVHDDPKVNVPGRYGDARPRIDIEIRRRGSGTWPRFRFEAKRLGPDHPIGKYVGSEGLGAFLSGYYPLTHPEAGMLGYIQEKDIPHWSAALQKALASTTDLKLAPEGMVRARLAPGLATWRTVHSIEGVGTISIWHSLLVFC
jgi:hypothetical protein